MERHAHGWKNKLTDDGRTDRQMDDGRTYIQTDEKTDRWMDGQACEQTDRWAEQTGRCVDRQMDT